MNETKLKALKVSILFNMGYLYEISHQLDQANMLYKRIQQTHPDYIDAFLRLAYLARQRGDINRAIFWIDEAAKSRARAPVN